MELDVWCTTIMKLGRATTCQVHRQRTWRSLRAQQRTRHFQEHPVLTQAEVWDASYKMVKHKSPSWEIPEPTLSVLSMGGWVPVLGWDKWRWLSAGNELTLSLVEEARRSLEHQKKVTSKYSTASIYIARPDKSISLYEHIIVAVHRQIRGNWWEKTSHILHNKIQVLTLLGNILLWVCVFKPTWTWTKISRIFGIFSVLRRRPW